MSEREVELTSEERDGLDYIVHRRPFRSDDARNIGLFTAVERIIAARLADAEARAVMLPDDEALAELLSWTTGDFTRWSPTAHPDHNRWSWRGEGHGDTMRQHYRDAARRLREALRGDQ